MSPEDLDALRAFYAENRQQLFTYALSMVGSREAAEDAIHGVFERLLRSRALPAGLRPYVFRGIRNAALDALRRNRVRTDSIFAVAAMGNPGESGSGNALEAEDLEPLLQRLSPDEREAIVLKIYGGLTFQEIADLRHVPLPTVSSWYRRGLERLRTLLKTER